MLTERDVLQQLEAALDVSPSPDFEARVREQVTRQAIRATGWMWPTAAAVVATAVLAVVLAPHREETSVRVTEPVTTEKVSTQPVLPAAQPTAAARRVRRLSTSAAIHPTPSVIVPDGQQEAIHRLVNQVVAGRVRIATAPVTSQAVLEISAIADAPAIRFDAISLRPISPEASPDLWR